MESNSYDRKGQVTIFVIIAILVVGAIAGYFLLRNVYQKELPANMKPAYDYYLTCLEEQTRQGISLLGEQGGYIEVPDFVPGSQYMPFSSQLSFFGQPVAYWMYVSGNNLLKEQMPSKAMMEEQLAKYIEERLNYCDFTDYNIQGYDVVIEPGSVKAKINNLDVSITADNDMKIFFGEQSASVNSHRFTVDTKLGKFYDLAVNVYNYEKQNMFLEKYAIDVLRLYAPVDGAEISCNPKVFNKPQIKSNLANAISENFNMLKLKGSYYSISDKDNNYFVTDIGQDIDENVNFIYSQDMPTKIEIYGDDVAQPIGLQEGLGILGFCYVPYHLVYDVNFPVLIQFYDSNELFQFPIAVIIDKTQARNALPSEAGTILSSDVCQYKNQKIEVNTYDSELNPVEARVRFKCLNSECDLGETSLSGSTSTVTAFAPQCVNGFIVASAEGYADSKYMISTNTETKAYVVLSKLYNLSLSVNNGNAESAIISFISEDYKTVAAYPETKSIKLREGMYNISVYVYKNSVVHFPGTSERKCFDIPQTGIAGIFGATKEKCIDINIPAQDINSAVIGGGKSDTYITESELRESGKLNVNVPVFSIPSNIQDIQKNYEQIDASGVELGFE